MEWREQKDVMLVREMNPLVLVSYRSSRRRRQRKRLFLKVPINAWMSQGFHRLSNCKFFPGNSEIKGSQKKNHSLTFLVIVLFSVWFFTVSSGYFYISFSTLASCRSLDLAKFRKFSRKVNKRPEKPLLTQTEAHHGLMTRKQIWLKLLLSTPQNNDVKQQWYSEKYDKISHLIVKENCATKYWLRTTVRQPF